jgi:hypothetical protein
MLFTGITDLDEFTEDAEITDVFAYLCKKICEIQCIQDGQPAYGTSGQSTRMGCVSTHIISMHAFNKPFHVQKHNFDVSLIFQYLTKRKMDTIC